jgi:hypothetical protein
MQSCNSTPIHIWAISHGYTPNDPFVESFNKRFDDFRVLLADSKNIKFHTNSPDEDALELYAEHRHFVIMSSAESNDAEKIFGVWKNCFAVFANFPPSESLGTLVTIRAEKIAAELEDFKSTGSLSVQPGKVFDQEHFCRIIDGLKIGKLEERIKQNCAPSPHLYKLVLDGELVLSRNMNTYASCQWIKTLDIDPSLRKLLAKGFKLYGNGIPTLLSMYRLKNLPEYLERYVEDCGFTNGGDEITGATLEKWADDINLFLEAHFKNIFSQPELQRYAEHYPDQG